MAKPLATPKLFADSASCRPRRSNMQRHLPLAVGAALLAIAFAAPAQKPVAYPAKGQSASQQSKDDGECLGFAKQNTGVDPSAPPPAPPPENRGNASKALPPAQRSGRLAATTWATLRPKVPWSAASPSATSGAEHSSRPLPPSSRTWASTTRHITRA